MNERLSKLGLTLVRWKFWTVERSDNGAFIAQFSSLEKLMKYIEAAENGGKSH